LNALIVQHEHFQLRELDKPLGEAFAHFGEAWDVTAESAP
jgi:hypothetical protein